MLSYLQKSGASYVCLYHHGKSKELRGNSVKAARTESIPHDLSVELTSLSVVPTADDTSPFHEKPVPLEVAETSTFKKYALESRLAVGAREDQDILIACCWVYQKAGACSTLFLKLYALTALMRRTMKADHC
jgi:hypothetical protein